MTRKLLQYLPFLLPFVGYAVYVVTARLLGRDVSWRGAPWLWLTGIGLALVIVSLVVLWAFDSGQGVEGNYVPPRFEGGEIRPGHVEPEPGR